MTSEITEAEVDAALAASVDKRLSTMTNSTAMRFILEAALAARNIHTDTPKGVGPVSNEGSECLRECRATNAQSADLITEAMVDAAGNELIGYGTDHGWFRCPATMTEFFEHDPIGHSEFQAIVAQVIEAALAAYNRSTTDGQ